MTKELSNNANFGYLVQFQLEDEDILEVFEEQLGGGLADDQEDVVEHLQKLAIDEPEHDQVSNLVGQQFLGVSLVTKYYSQ